MITVFASCLPSPGCLRACCTLLAGSILTSEVLGQCQTWSTQFDDAHVFGNGVYAMQPFDDGTGLKLWVGGDFGATSGVAYIGKWDGQQWTSACCLSTTSVNALCSFDAGQGPELYAGYATDSGYGCISLWTGGQWVLVGGGLNLVSQLGPQVMAMTVFDSGSGPELYIGGEFDGSSTVSSKGLIRWDGANWNAVVSGLATSDGHTPYANVLTVYNSGSGPELYAAGNFYFIGGVTSQWIARWNGRRWSPLGLGVNGQVTGMGVWNDGAGEKLYVSGSFTMAGGQPATRVAIWNGSSWSPMGVPPLGSPYAMLGYDDGRGPALYFGAWALVDGMQAHAISRWDGTKWSALGGGVGDSVRCMAAYDDGSGHGADLYVGGSLSGAGGGIQSARIARWIRCPGPIDTMCPGDKTLAVCPCSNTGLSGHGCQNSANTGGALLSTAGTLSPDTVRFGIAGELPHSLTILLQGDAPADWTWNFGDGLRCAGGHLLRMYVTNAVNGVANVPPPGQQSITMRSASMGYPITPGSIRIYQAYYRDPDSVCATGFNVSNGARIVWPGS
jgi:hypothetical protein